MFAVVLDSKGTPVSLLKEGLSAFVDYGQNATLQAKSMGGWTCLGPKDPNDTYEILYLSLIQL